MHEATLGIIATALIWGVTDPFMKRFASYPSYDSWLSDLVPFLKNWRYAVTFAVNQAGSVTFMWTLTKASLSYVVPATNSLKFLATFLTGQLLGEGSPTARSWIGLLLITCGISLHQYDHVYRLDNE